MKRVLLFAPYFLPRRRVGSMRPFRFAIHLREFGWDPYVLTIATPGQELTDKEAQLLADVKILRIEPPFDRTSRSESQLGSTTRSRRDRSQSLFAKLATRLDEQFPIDTWMLLFASKYREIVRYAREIQPDVLWATGDPWSGLVVGRWLSERLGIPYVADFRDPWTLSEVRSDGLWAVTRALNKRAERSVIEGADLVLFQAEQVESAYRSHYRDVQPSTLTIRNSFDADVFDHPVRLGVQAEVNRSDGLHIGFFGRFRSMSPATLIIDALSDVRQRHGAAAENIFVHSFGNLTSDDARYARDRGIEAQFVAHDAVPLEKALGVLRSFHILLVSTEVRRERIIPAKLFEYLAAGRPILSLSRNQEVEDILQRTKTGVQLREAGEVADVLADSLRAVEAGAPLPILFDPVPGEILRYDARSTTRRLAEAMDALTS